MADVRQFRRHSVRSVTHDTLRDNRICDFETHVPFLDTHCIQGIIIMEVSGFCDTRFDRVRAAFEDNFATLGDVGASFALTVDGEYAIDMWAGNRDAGGTRDWQKDTIINVYSSTKTMMALCALLLADRGELDVEQKVSHYWPEFAQNGKEAICVKHFLSHSSGLSGMTEPTAGDDFYDWDLMCGRLAAQAPWWEPGKHSGYHAITQGYLVGEVVRRITGRTLGTFFREEFAEPLSADFHIGVDPTHFGRIAELIAPTSAPGAGLPADSVAARTFGNAMIEVAASTTEAWRRAEIPAANGHGNARSIVRAQSLLANGGTAFGKQIMTPEGCRRALEVQVIGDDLVLGVPARFGLGYGLSGPETPISPNANTCFWGGWGGSTVVVDQDAHLCFSYVMNKMDDGVTGDKRGGNLAAAVYASLA